MPHHHWPIARRPQPTADRLPPTWRDAVPARIAASLQAAARRDPGGWFVAAPSRAVTARTSVVRTVAGHELSLWRSRSGDVVVGPGACPHMGALMDGCVIVDDAARCRWHGLALRPDVAGFTCLDDGALVWVRLPVDHEASRPGPVRSPRPDDSRSMTSVLELTGTCEPSDVIANRLDPWHGSWFHPYAFSHLRVDDASSTPDRLVVDVTFRLGRTWGVPVRAEFTCPDARTVVMRVVDGEGVGSVVETHATPVGSLPDGRARTRVTEVAVATSARLGFRLTRPAHRLVTPLMRHTQRRLWNNDMAYAERRYELRRRRTSECLPRIGTDHNS